MILFEFLHSGLARLFFINFALLFCITSGCKKSDQLPTAPVSGKVILDGKPLTTGIVNFIPQGAGRAAKANIQPDGSFTLGTYKLDDGAIIGVHKVTVVAYRSGVQIESDQNVFLLPAKYASAVESGLEFEVKSDQKNEVTLELKSK